MSDTDPVAVHYGRTHLLNQISEGLRRLGAEPPFDPDVLASVDEFHIGGRLATGRFMQQLHLEQGQSVLDLGCGLGGPARYAAHHYGVAVTGVDLTQVFVDTGQALSAMTGQADQVNLVQGSILDLPFESESFDAAYMIHVGMNISDKAGVAREAARVLKLGGIFAIYDVMQVGQGTVDFPVPWASTAEQSALDAPDAYRTALLDAGFEILSEADRSGFAKDFFARLAAQQATADGPPPLGLHLVMGPNTAQKVQHMVSAIGDGRIAPIEMIARRTG
jgi:SAM-dependent methyltransferase